MRREGLVRGKPTSKSRVTGRCMAGKTRCRGCREHPVEKSRSKRMGRYKRFAVDVRSNPSLAEFSLQPSPKHVHVSSFHDVVACELEELFRLADGRVSVATVNSVIEAALSKMHGCCGEDGKMEDTTAMACAAFELASGNGADLIPAIEEVFHRELGIFEKAMKDSDFSETHFALKGVTAVSEESWSDVELSESSSHDDDWTMVDDGNV